jgi:hypothetical protein
MGKAVSKFGKLWPRARDDHTGQQSFRVEEFIRA